MHLLADLNPAKNALISIIHSFKFLLLECKYFSEVPHCMPSAGIFCHSSCAVEIPCLCHYCGTSHSLTVLGLVVICFTLCDLFSNSGLSHSR